MISQRDYSSAGQNFSDKLLHRVKLPGFYSALTAKLLNDKAPNEFDAEPVGLDIEGQSVYALFWHIPDTLDTTTADKIN